MAWVTVGNAIRTVMAALPTAHVYTRRHYAEPSPWQVRVIIEGTDRQRMFHSIDIIDWVNQAELVLAVIDQHDVWHGQSRSIIRVPVPMNWERARTVQAQIRLILLAKGTSSV